MIHSIRRIALPLILVSVTGCAMPGDWNLPTVRNPFTFKRSTGDSAYARASGELKQADKMFLSYARWKENIGQDGEARKTYDDILQSEPQNLSALIGRARLDQKAGMAEQAEQTLLTALDKHPENTDLLHALGELYVREERFDEAMIPLQQAVDASPYHAFYRFDLAVAQTEAGRTDQALANFAVCVGKAEGYYNAGYVLQQRGDLDRAEELYRQAIALKPNLPQAQTMLTAIDKHRRAETQIARMKIEPGGTNIDDVKAIVEAAGKRTGGTVNNYSRDLPSSVKQVARSADQITENLVEHAEAILPQQDDVDLAARKFNVPDPAVAMPAIIGGGESRRGPEEVVDTAIADASTALQSVASVVDSKTADDVNDASVAAVETEAAVRQQMSNALADVDRGMNAIKETAAAAEESISTGPKRISGGIAASLGRADSTVNSTLASAADAARATAASTLADTPTKPTATVPGVVIAASKTAPAAGRRPSAFVRTTGIQPLSKLAR